MSVSVWCKVWNCKGFTAAEKLVLLWLANQTNDEGELIIPSTAAMARDCDLSLPVVESIHEKLKHGGVLVATEERSGDEVISKIDFDALERLPKTPTALSREPVKVATRTHPRFDGSAP